MKTAWKPLGRSPHSYSTLKQWAAEFTRGRGSVGDDGRSGRPKDATADESVNVLIGGETCES